MRNGRSLSAVRQRRGAALPNPDYWAPHVGPSAVPLDFRIGTHTLATGELEGRSPMTERPPSRIIYLPEIPETEYGQFYLALPRDSRLPASYREWYESFAREDQAH